MTSNNNHQVTFLSALLHLERRLRQAATIGELSQRLGNETRNLIHYQQLIVWRRSPKGIVIEAISGVDRVSALAPFNQMLTAVIGRLRKHAQANSIQRYSREEVADLLVDQQPDEVAWQELLWVPLNSTGTPPVAGMLVIREQGEWNDQECNLFERLRETAYHAWHALKPRFETPRRQRHGWRALILAVLIASACLPVRLSVLAPAEVVAEQQFIVSAPQDGIVAEIHVQPNQQVTSGELLITLDQTALTNQLNVAEQALAVVKAQYQQAEQRSFNDPQARENMRLLQAQQAQRLAERDYAQSLLAQTRIVASHDGIAVFSDANQWLGRPVRTGERIMTIASPTALMLNSQIPAADMIDLDHQQPATFFLNVAPTSPLAANIDYIAYEAVLDPQLGPVYPVKAHFSSATPSRLGSRGSVRFYGHKAPVIYTLLRKPLARLRQLVGF